jgi:uncharacterized phage protein gp47/JayE
MAFNRPTLTELIERTAADVASRVATVGSILRRSVLGIVSRAIAGAAHELYGYLDYIARQCFPDTAETEYLERWANVWGITRSPAEYAEGNVTFTGTNGSVIASGTQIRRQDGALFETTASGTISGGTATVAAIAVDAGADGNTTAAIIMSLVSPVSGVNSSVTVASGGIVNGSDADDDDALRAALLNRIQRPPQGGAENDYITWALEVPGVTRAWIYPAELGIGTVTVRFVRDDDASLIPDAGEVTAVQDYIDERRPVTADVYVVAPTASAQNYSISIKPNNAETQAAVTAELADLHLRESIPGGTLPISKIREAVSISAGVTDSAVTVPTADVVAGTGVIKTLGAITFATLP